MFVINIDVNPTIKSCIISYGWLVGYGLWNFKPLDTYVSNTKPVDEKTKTATICNCLQIVIIDLTI